MFLKYLLDRMAAFLGRIVSPHPTLLPGAMALDLEEPSIRPDTKGSATDLHNEVKQIDPFDSLTNRDTAVDFDRDTDEDLDVLADAINEDVVRDTDTTNCDDTSNDRPLEDIVRYAVGVQLPPVPWISRLALDQERVNVHCLSTLTRFVKRTADIVIASIMLVLLLPLMLIVAVLVKFTSPGEAIFKQTRVGLNLRAKPNDRRHRDEVPPQPPGERRQSNDDRRNTSNYGKLFTIYKFRTMTQDAEKNGAQFSSKSDARITPLGGFLRKTRIDELPQLWNVLKGEMSLVGPRPERPVFIEGLSEQIPDYLRRLGLKPGLTGVAQIVNGYDNDIEGFRRKVAFDLFYLQNCCLWNDLKILFRTIAVVVGRKGM